MTDVLNINVNNVNNVDFEKLLKCYNNVKKNQKQYHQSEKGKIKVCEASRKYYNDRKDFKTYLTFRCINNRSVLNKPDIEHMSSNEFCFESWKENK